MVYWAKMSSCSKPETNKLKAENLDAAAVI